jgi:CelD/BcsL family acetyltransferase involved in cellulose biosynthesis
MNYDVIQDSLDDLSAIWNDPGQKLAWPSVFVLPAWMSVWWHVFAPAEDGQPFIRTVRQDGNVVGIAPLMLAGDTAAFIGDTSVCDYQDLVTVPGREKDFCGALLDDLKQNDIRALDLAHVRPESMVMTVLAPLAEARGLKVTSDREAVSYEMDLPSSFDDYVESLTTKQRHEVRRKLRRMSEAGNVEYRWITDRAGVPAAMDTFFRMFVESRQDKADFLTKRMETFFRRLADAMAALGLLKLGVLELDNRPVAQIMCFDYNDCIYLYNSGYDPDYTALSAGLLSKVLAIKESIEQGKRRFDFLKGAEVYKGHLGGREVPLYRCRIAIK